MVSGWFLPYYLIENEMVSSWFLPIYLIENRDGFWLVLALNSDVHRALPLAVQAQAENLMTKFE